MTVMYKDIEKSIKCKLEYCEKDYERNLHSLENDMCFVQSECLERNMTSLLVNMASTKGFIGGLKYALDLINIAKKEGD